MIISILKSKVDAHWKRKKNNFNDNYDLYLKTIVTSWINSVYINATNDEKVALDNLRFKLNDQPYYADKQINNIFLLRDNEKVAYLSALMLYEKNNKNKK